MPDLNGSAGEGTVTQTAETRRDVLAGFIPRFADFATHLAEALRRPGSFPLYSVTYFLAEIAREITSADVAYCRRVGHDELLELKTQVIWAPECDPVGEVVAQKHRDDCKAPFDRIDGWARNAALNLTARNRRKPNGESFYTNPELVHFEWLGSEAFIPLGVDDEEVAAALITLGHHDPQHFTPARLDALRAIWGFFKAFFQLAELIEERATRTVFLERVAQVLGEFAAAPSLLAYQRAVCTLLTCNHGFGFDRALLFWMETKQLPAVCQMAVGGTGPDWPEQRKEVADFFAKKGLADYVRYAMTYPVPGDGPCPIKDPLYESVCRSGKGLFFRSEDGGKIREVVEHGGHCEPPAPELSSADSWVSKIQAERDDVFVSPRDQYFLLPLLPFGGEEQSPLLGFVIVDLAYRPQRHAPGLNFPDLEMAAIVMRLVAGIWLFRENTESYYHILAALPILRHGAPDLAVAVELLRKAMDDDRVTQDSGTRRELAELSKIKDELCRAKDIVEGMRQRRIEMCVDAIADFVENKCRDSQEKHAGKLICRVGNVAYAGAVRIPPEALDTILGCVIDNAMHGHSEDRPGPVLVTVGVRKIEVPEPQKVVGHRVLIEVANDGVPIPDGYKDCLFVNRVSTSSGDGHGTGLSSARLQANAYGGDVAMLSSNPVRFGIVLDINTTS